MKYQAKQHYQDSGIAVQYDAERFTTWYGKMAHEQEAKALQSALAKYVPKAGTVLDLPCGTGRLWPVLLNHGLKVTGGDISEEMMSVARRHFEKHSAVTFAKVDAEHIPFGDQQFDFLTSYRLFCHLPAKIVSQVVSEMIRVTKDVLILNFHVSTLAPLYLMNSFFRKSTCPPYPIALNDVKGLLNQFSNIRILEISKLSWYERSSTLAVLKKTSS